MGESEKEEKKTVEKEAEASGEHKHKHEHGKGEKSKRHGKKTGAKKEKEEVEKKPEEEGSSVSPAETTKPTQTTTEGKGETTTTTTTTKATVTEIPLDIKLLPEEPFLSESEVTPLARLVMDGDAEGLKKALEEDGAAGLVSEALGASGVTLLHLAAMRGNPAVLSVLLEHGANRTARDAMDNTPLHYATYYDHRHTAEALLAGEGKEGSALNKRNEQGATPLYFAAAHGNAELCALLLARGANASATGPQNRTPLHEAVLARNAACVERLVQGGTDLAVRDRDQRTVLHYAVLLPVEVRAIVALLTGATHRFDDVDRYGYTALHYAVLQNYDDSIGLFTLVTDGANVCVVYDLRLLMEQNRAPPLPPLPACIPLPRHRARALARDDSQLLLTGTPSVLYEPAPVVPTSRKASVDRAGRHLYGRQAEKGAAKGNGGSEGEDGQESDGTEGDGEGREQANRFGFEVITKMTNVGELSGAALARERELSEKWAGHLRNWERFARNRKQLKELCAQGLPEAVRGEVWKRLGDVPALLKKQPHTYARLVATAPRRDIAHQLDLDVKRSHLEHERFARPYTAGQLALFNVMRAYSLHDTVVEYTQGMSDVAGLLLMYLTEEDTFWLFTQLMFDDRWQLQGVFAAGFPLLHQHCFVEALLLAKYHPAVLRHMKKVDFDPYMLQPHAMEWFMTLYIRVLPYAFTVRIFDVLLSRGYYVVFRVAMALFEIMKKQILATTEYPDLMQMLKNPTESCPELSKMTPDEFMKVVMRYKVTQKMVDKIVVQYKKQQEEQKTK